MNQIWLLNTAMSVLFVVIIVNGLHSNNSYDRWISVGFLLPEVLFFLLMLSVLTYSTVFGRGMLQRWTSDFLNAVLIIGLYCLVMSAVYPFLRRHLNAKTMVQLWILPNFLYVFFVANIRHHATTPYIIIKLPDVFLRYVLPVWFIGFAIYLLYRITLHLIFRRQMMKELASPSETVRSLWEKTFKEAMPDRKKTTELWISSEAKTPMTIGIFRQVILLPARHYTEEELVIIFRHELVHLRRSDTGTRFYIAFCTAVLWFFPPVWKRLQHIAEDIEVSCDETVLDGAGDETRRDYAKLILKTAGDSRGFTSALSTSAASLQYRLEQILRPVKRRSGTILTGILMFTMMLASNSIAYAYSPQKINDLLFHDQPVSLESVSLRSNSTNTVFRCTDEAQLVKALGEFTVWSLDSSGTIPTDMSADTLNISLKTGGHQYKISIQGNLLTVYKKNLYPGTVYVLENGTIDSLLSYLEYDPSTDYRLLLPVMTLQFSEKDNNLSVECIGAIQAGSPPVQEDSVNYSFTHVHADLVVLRDIHSDSVQLLFSQPFVSCTVWATPADYYHEYQSAEHHTPLDIQPEWTSIDYTAGDELSLSGPGTFYSVTVRFLNGNELDHKTEQQINNLLPPGIAVTDWYDMNFTFEILE